VGPGGIAPSLESGERFVEGSTEIGQLIEGGGVDAGGIEVAYDQAVAFGSSEGVGQHFVRNAVEGIIEFLVAATPVL
jgi:hypothetical protein